MMGARDSMDSFHWCALAAGSIATQEGRFDDKEYVKTLAYAMYEAVIKVRKADA